MFLISVVFLITSLIYIRIYFLFYVLNVITVLNREISSFWVKLDLILYSGFSPIFRLNNFILLYKVSLKRICIDRVLYLEVH